MSRCKASLFIILAIAGMIAPTRAADAPPDAPPPELPRDTLAKLYRTELGDQFKDTNLQKLISAHELLEKYFAAESSGQRSEIVTRIDATGLDRPTIGHLARLRMDWQPLAPGVYYINQKNGPLEVRYFLGIPKSYDLTKPWPLVVKLPVPNAFLTTPPPDAQRVTDIYTQWITAELTAHPDAIVLMPLLNLDELYGPGPVGMNLVMQPIFDATNRANIDPARVYLQGHSMAAHAVWNLAIHYPTYFAAINPMAGSMHDAWQRFRLGNLQNILSVVWHDASDEEVKVVESREIVRYLRHLQYDVDYTETQSVGHVPPPSVLQDEYQELRTRTRDLYPRQVFIQSNSAETIYNRADWVQIYQPLSPGQQAKVQFSRGSQGMYLYQNGFRVTAHILDQNTINVETRNVRVLRLYLNEQMVDLNQPVKVTVNSVTRYNQIPPQSTAEMLKDQLFLTRGWRYYTAVIDLDLTETPTTHPATPTQN
jgi:predicted esterase